MSTINKYPEEDKKEGITLIKSALRIIGYTLIPSNIMAAASMLIISEMVGIIEELV